MNKDVKMILDALSLLHTACENIEGMGACDKCPIRKNCLEDTSPLDIAEDVTVKQLDEFLGLSDDVEEYLEEQEINSDENQRALYADWQRQCDIEEQMIDEEWGI